MSPEATAKVAEALRHHGLREFDAGGITYLPARGMFAWHAQVFGSYAHAIAGVAPNRKQIPFVLLDRSDLNACAFRHENEGYVGINWGSVLVLHDLFLRMMASPTFMPEIGAADGEEALEELPRLETDCVALPRTPELPYGLVTAPYDPVRTIYAAHLTQIALDFLFLHEYRHVEGGHLHWSDPITAYMAQVEATPPEELVTRHIFELEADAFAANFSLKLACDMKGNAWRIDEAIAPYQSSLKSRYVAWLVAIFTVFSVIEVADRRQTDRPSSHPSAILMRAFFAQFLFAHYGPLKANESARLSANLFDTVHRTLRSLFEEPISMAMSFELFGPDRETHMRILGDRWREMSPRLDELGAANGCKPVPSDLREAFLVS